MSRQKDPPRIEVVKSRTGVDDNDSDSTVVDIGFPSPREEDGSRLTTLSPRWKPCRGASYDPRVSGNGTEHSTTKV